MSDPVRTPGLCKGAHTGPTEPTEPLQFSLLALLALCEPRPSAAASARASARRPEARAGAREADFGPSLPRLQSPFPAGIRPRSNDPGRPHLPDAHPDMKA